VIRRSAGGVEPPSSSGLGRRPFKAVTRVRIPLGVRKFQGSRSRGAVWSARRPVKPEAAGSNPVGTATAAPVPGRWPNGRVAQLAERPPEKRKVTGSTPVPTTSDDQAETPGHRAFFGLDASDRQRPRVATSGPWFPRRSARGRRTFYLTAAACSNMVQRMARRPERHGPPALLELALQFCSCPSLLLDLVATAFLLDPGDSVLDSVGIASVAMLLNEGGDAGEGANGSKHDPSDFTAGHRHSIVRCTSDASRSQGSKVNAVTWRGRTTEKCR
jgi:hypothetical protein